MNDINILLHILIIHSAVSLIFAFKNLTNHVKKKKIRSKWLYISGAIYALSIYLISFSWADLWILPLVFVAHFLAYLIMIPKRRTLFNFFLSQINIMNPRITNNTLFEFHKIITRLKRKDK
jgi:hypothetical protein